MLNRGEHKLLFTQLSEILRRYFENRYFIKALEETTSEISNSLEEVNIENVAKNSALSILEFSDLVKFAKYIPAELEVENQFRELENFIHQTKLVFEEVEARSVTNQIAETTPSESVSESSKQSIVINNNN